ncbi:MAG: putative NUDIX hydrolase [Parcubacteria group bacterium Licking1014_1]|nr:MAG: putative NUDIX hydrolase [Parcubacteria group bacterium Licking1014_1]
MKQATLCLLIKGNEILLAMKKRGFGVGRWNGTGGKLDFEKGDKNVIDSVIRETKEEIGVLIKDPEKVGVLHFYFPHKKEWNQDVYLFLAKNWEGEPTESEEMAPKWFEVSEIPYDKMWDDDKYWLPHILSGKKLEADFIFKEGDIIDKHDIKIVEEI